MKHRLIGALVIVALATLFLPMILDGKDTFGKIQSKIPPKPLTYEDVVSATEASKVKASDAIPAAKVDTGAVADSAFDEASEVGTSVQSTFEQKPLVGQKVTDTMQQGEGVAPSPATGSKPSAFKRSGWILRVGTFNKKQNADNLVKALEREAFNNIFVKALNFDNGRVAYQVYIGPDLEKSTVQQWHARIKTRLALSGVIESYNPSQHSL